MAAHAGHRISGARRRRCSGGSAGVHGVHRQRLADDAIHPGHALLKPRAPGLARLCKHGHRGARAGKPHRDNIRRVAIDGDEPEAGEAQPGDARLARCFAASTMRGRQPMRAISAGRADHADRYSKREANPNRAANATESHLASKIARQNGSDVSSARAAATSGSARARAHGSDCVTTNTPRRCPPERSLPVSRPASKRARGRSTARSGSQAMVSRPPHPGPRNRSSRRHCRGTPGMADAAGRRSRVVARSARR